MKMAEVRRRQRLIDRWWPEWGSGVVEKVLKTRIRIRFGDELMTYDSAHVQFLEKA